MLVSKEPCFHNSTYDLILAYISVSMLDYKISEGRNLIFTSKYPETGAGIIMFTEYVNEWMNQSKTDWTLAGK